jgi:hypothetical protein
MAGSATGLGMDGGKALILLDALGEARFPYS